MSEHISSRKLYFVVCICLLTLTIVTWQIAYVDLGRWNMIVALIISITKTALVGAFFMHLRWSSSIVRLVVFAAIFWLAIMLTLTLGDIFTRNTVTHSQPWPASIVVSQPAAPAPQR